MSQSHCLAQPQSPGTPQRCLDLEQRSCSAHPSVPITTGEHSWGSSQQPGTITASPCFPPARHRYFPAFVLFSAPVLSNARNTTRQLERPCPLHSCCQGMGQTTGRSTQGLVRDPTPGVVESMEACVDGGNLWLTPKGQQLPAEEITGIKYILCFLGIDSCGSTTFPCNKTSGFLWLP